MKPTLDPPVSSQALLFDVIRSAYVLPVLLAADQAGVFASLDDNPASAEELAQRFDIGLRSAETMLGVLAAKGFLTKTGGRFHLLDVAREFLLPGSVFYVGGWLEMWRSGAVNTESVYKALFNRQPAYAEVLDADHWESVPDPAQLRKFTSSMHAASLPSAVGVAAHGDFAGVDKLLDVAGGSGCFSIALALRYPEMGLTVMELPGVCDIVPGYTQPWGLGDRIRTLAADMFDDEWPGGFDAHFLSNIFHDWSPARCRVLAQRSFDALPSGGRIYLHEEMANDTHDGPLTTMLYSMNMVAWTKDGRQYTSAELAEFLTSAGFGEVRVTYTYGRFSLLVASKP